MVENKALETSLSSLSDYREAIPHYDLNQSLLLQTGSFAYFILAKYFFYHITYLSKTRFESACCLVIFWFSGSHVSLNNAEDIEIISNNTHSENGSRPLSR